MKNILFTKAIDNSRYQQYLGKSYRLISEDFIQVEYVDRESIIEKLNDTNDYYLVSSQRATKHIKDLSLHQEFMVVGHKSRRLLKASGHQVKHCSETAIEMLDYIKKNVKNDKIFTFFCSQIRRDTLPEGLRQLGHTVNEIICYNTQSRSVSIDGSFDAYVFLSPSGVKSFAQQYEIPKKASIFAMGETTRDAVRRELGINADIPPNATLTSLVQFIKIRLDAEK